MVLDDKQEGEKLWAFEVNNITKAIRGLKQNVADLNERTFSKDKGTVASTSQDDSLTVPEDVAFVVVAIKIGGQSNETNQGDVFLDKYNKTTAVYQSWSDASNSYYRTTFTWSDDTITWATEESSSATEFGLNFYFY